MPKYTIYQAAFVREFTTVEVEADNEEDALHQYQSMDEQEWTRDTDYWDEEDAVVTEVLPFLMWLKFTDQQGTRWAAICPTGGEPYEYETRDAARRMLKICYPDQCRDERLGGEVVTAVLPKGEVPS